jgi:hypothetical protein
MGSRMIRRGRCLGSELGLGRVSARVLLRVFWRDVRAVIQQASEEEREPELHICRTRFVQSETDLYLSFLCSKQT